jgi:hypothetical protein
MQLWACPENQGQDSFERVIRAKFNRNGLKDIFEVDGNIRKRLRGDDSVRVRFSRVIVLLGLELIDVHCFLADIDNPVLLYTASFVGSEFIVRIIVRVASATSTTK